MKSILIASSLLLLVACDGGGSSNRSNVTGTDDLSDGQNEAMMILIGASTSTYAESEEISPFD